MDENKDSYTIEDVIHIMLSGTDKEKEQVLASMIHAMNVQLDHLENTLKGLKDVQKYE